MAAAAVSGVGGELLEFEDAGVLAGGDLLQPLLDGGGPLVPVGLAAVPVAGELGGEQLDPAFAEDVPGDAAADDGRILDSLTVIPQVPGIAQWPGPHDKRIWISPDDVHRAVPRRGGTSSRSLQAGWVRTGIWLQLPDLRKYGPAARCMPR